MTLLHVGPNPASVYGRNALRPLTMTNYNSFRNLYLHSAKEGIVMDAGPGNGFTSKGDSGCWYNAFYTMLIEYSDRGIWLRAPRHRAALLRDSRLSVLGCSVLCASIDRAT